MENRVTYHSDGVLYPDLKSLARVLLATHQGGCRVQRHQGTNADAPNEQEWGVTIYDAPGIATYYTTHAVFTELFPCRNMTVDEFAAYLRLDKLALLLGQ